MLTAVILMPLSVYARDGSGTFYDPYIVYNYDELKNSLEGGGYTKLGADISGSFDTIEMTQTKSYLDLNGHAYVNENTSLTTSISVYRNSDF